MNHKSWMGAAAIALLLLSGCGEKQAAPSSANASAGSSQGQAQTQQNEGQKGSAAAEQGKGERPVMNEKERQQFMTFQSLLMMDKQQNLAITKEEATSMLPIVQDSIAKKELSDDQSAKLTGLLNADQKKFLDDNASRMQNRGRGGSGAGEGGSNGNGKPPAGQQGGSAGADKSAGQNNNQTDHSRADRPQRPAGGQPGSGQGQGGPGGGGFKSPGDQLVELLQNKIKS
ncbi:hypothetical protein [Paenibacillus thalictri]|uniref:Lipoprotein n=1 Tax=Paenibacillus thalictri TaxID=2527873 RepID=A0A4Q9DSW4_9BACL|nr:hypothetical protein [Paenibacillus thalictri]TBL79994.1 hypothetical protein EYB31_10450 [Paenibacillus thalictri]